MFRLSKSFSVAVGTFNIYAFRLPFVTSLISPQAGDELKIESDFFQAGFKYVFADNQATWLVRPDRFVVESGDPSHNCGNAVAGVLRGLPWTPISAVGHNFRFSGPTAPEPAPFLLPDFYTPGPEVVLKQKTWHVAIAKDNATYNLSLEKEESGLTLVANVHYPLESQDALSGVKFALGFESFRTAVRDLVRDVFQVSID